MYLSDYHMHGALSFDTNTPMIDMARAAVDAGLNEICFTDHVDVCYSGSDVRNEFDFPALERAYDALHAALSEPLLIRRGMELGEATRDFAHAEKLLRQAPEMDFIIGSQHQLSGAYGHVDLYYCAAKDEQSARAQIEDYLTMVLQLAKWGKFSVLGHLTLPLRYMNENNGLHMTFDGHEPEVEEIFRTLIQNGCGIECNTNRGNVPLPDEKWLRMYRALGGEIITVGTDAHTPEYVGCHVREVQELLRSCGFSYHCTFDKLKPIFHKL